MRELLLMHEGRLKNEWQQTASIMAILCNINRGKDQKAFSPDDFMPKFRATKTDEVIRDTKLGFRMLKSIADNGKNITKKGRK
jgi:hypothetical protein